MGTQELTKTRACQWATRGNRSVVEGLALREGFVRCSSFGLASPSHWSALTISIESAGRWR